MEKFKRIVLTGGPGGGKTTISDLLTREFGNDIVLVPEAATMLYKGGFPRQDDREIKKITQKAIFDVQKSLERIQFEIYSDRHVICDRGSIDGAAYWPEGPESFFSTMQTSFEKEASQYDAVIFFETAAAGKLSISEGNSTRTEDFSEAIDIDKRLRKVYEAHNNFIFIQHEKSFFDKLTKSLNCLRGVLFGE